MLYAIVRNRKVEVKEPSFTVRNGINVDTLRLEMDEEWGKMDQIVVLFANSAAPETVKEMLFDYAEGTVQVPWEVLQESGRLSLSCVGYVGEPASATAVMRTAKPESYWDVIQEGDAKGNPPLEPTPDLLAQIMAAVANANDAAALANTNATFAKQVGEELKEAAARGEFDGKPGKPGTPGTPGRDGRDGRDGVDGLNGKDGKDGNGVYFAHCYDDAAPAKLVPNLWYIPKTMPRPSGEVGTMVDVMWMQGRENDLGYDVQLIWGEPGGADNEIIVDQTNTTDGLTGEYSIPVEGTVRYQLEETNGRQHWRYVSGPLLPRQFSTETEADVADKVVPSLQLAYLPGQSIYVTLDKGNTAAVMRLVPDEGPTLPVYTNGKRASTGDIPVGYICHLINAGDHWLLDNLGVPPHKLVVTATANPLSPDTYVADYKASEIRNADISGNMVELRYTTPSGDERLYRYEDFKAGQAVFRRIYPDTASGGVWTRANIMVNENKTIDINYATGKAANPKALRFTGAATGEYDGTEAVTVFIPSGGGGGGTGKDGGYYIPEVTQPDPNTMRVSYAASDISIPPVAPVDVKLVPGKDGSPGTPGAPGKDGSPGAAGQPGFSPVVEVSAISNGHRVTITDADGPQSFNVENGKNGSPGTPGTPGATPVKGVDYFTPAEVQDITDNAANDAANRDKSASKITAGTFKGQVVASAAGQAPGSYCLRNQKVSLTAENPTVNGQICWFVK